MADKYTRRKFLGTVGAAVAIDAEAAALSYALPLCRL
jgi:hypothetical protein